MKALSALSKFLGIYEDYRRLIRNYGLKWTGRNGDDLIIARLTKSVNGNEIIEWIRTVKQQIPEIALFMDFIAVTGLRLNEALNAYNLIVQLSRQNRLKEYYKPDNEILEHFRFKSFFIRRTKKAFISFVSKQLIDEIAKSEPLTIDMIRKRIQRRKLSLRFSDIREFNASILTKHLRRPEIDFIQGRVSSSVFMRNYFNPVWITDLKDRTLKAQKEMLFMISGY